MQSTQKGRSDADVGCFMRSQHTDDVVAYYTQRHEVRHKVFGGRKFANYGYWTREGMTMDEASEELTDLVARAGQIKYGDFVLDAGCGYGANAVLCVKRYHPSRVIGIDVTDVRIAAGQQYIAECELSDVIDLRIGDATKLAFPDGSFDRVIAVECAFHFDTRRDFLREAGRVLRPGGTLALTDMIPRRGVNPANYQKGHRAVGSGVCLEMPVNAYDADVYEGYLRASGFDQVRIESIVDKTTIPYYRMLENIASKVDAARALALKTAATTLRRYVDGGEDYVLVCARKAS